MDTWKTVTIKLNFSLKDLLREQQKNDLKNFKAGLFQLFVKFEIICFCKTLNREMDIGLPY